MTSIILFCLAIVLPLYIGWRVWKTLDQSARHSPDSETVSALLQKVALTGATVLLLMGSGLWLIDLLVPKTLS